MYLVIPTWQMFYITKIREWQDFLYKSDTPPNSAEYTELNDLKMSVDIHFFNLKFDSSKVEQ